MIIYNYKGEEIIDVLYASNSVKKKTLSGEDYISLVFVLKKPVYFSLGDYILYEGEKYVITDQQLPTYQESTDSYKYELQFDAYYKEFKNKICFYLPDTTMKESAFKITATIDVQLSVILKAIEYHKFNHGVNYSFVVGDVKDKKEAKLVSYDSLSILDALNTIATTWDCEYWVSHGVITFGRNNFGTPVDFKIGDNVASMSNSKSQSDGATRYYAFGSTTNIPDYYRKDLIFTPSDGKIDGSKAYIHDSNKPLKARHFRSEAFSDGVKYSTREINLERTEAKGEGTSIQNITISIPLGSAEDNYLLKKGSYTIVPQEGLFRYILSGDKQPLESLFLQARIVYTKITETTTETDDDAVPEVVLTPNVCSVCNAIGGQEAPLEASAVVITASKDITKISYDKEIDFSAMADGEQTRMGTTWLKRLTSTSFALMGTGGQDNIYGDIFGAVTTMDVFCDKVSSTLTIYKNRAVPQAKEEKKREDNSTKNEVELTNLVYLTEDRLVYDGLENNVATSNGAFVLEEDADSARIEFIIQPKEKENNTDEYTLIGIVDGSLEVRKDKEEDLKFAVNFRGKSCVATLEQDTNSVYVSARDAFYIAPTKEDTWTIEDGYIYKGKIPTSYFKSIYEDQVVTGVVDNHLRLPLTDVLIDKKTYKEADETTEETYSYKGKGYVDIGELTDSEVVEKVIELTDVYPMRESNVVDVTTRTLYDKEENADGTYSRKEWKAYRVICKEQDFDKDYINRGETLKVKFLEGKLAGMEFEAEFIQRAKDSKGNYCQCFEIVRNEDYGRPLPDDTLFPKPMKSKNYDSGDVDPESDNYRGDTFCLLNFNVEYVGDSYLPEAEKNLLGKVYEYIDDVTVDSNNYDCTMFSVPTYEYWRLNNVHNQYDIGQRVKLINASFFKLGYRDSRVMGYEIRLDKPYDAPVYTIGEEAKYSLVGELKTEIDSLTIKGASLAQMGGKSGGAVDIVTSNDNRAWTDYNVLSARRSGTSLMRKDQAEITQYPLTINNDFSVNGRSNLNVVKASSYRSYDYDNGDNYEGGRGFAMYKSNGLSKIEIDNLLVRNKAIFTELEIRQYSYVGGNMVYSVASSTVDYVEELDSTYFKIYIKLEENSIKVVNPWVKDDLLKCQTFNIDGTNKSYGFCVADTGEDEKGTFIKVYMNKAKLDDSKFSDVAKGDKIVQMGNRTNTERGNIIVIETSGDNAPCILMYENVTSWVLNNYLVKKDSPKGTIQKTSSFKLATDMSKEGTQLVIDRGEYDAKETYHYYDRVSYNGSLWLCVVEETTNAPTSEVWVCQVKKGTDGKNGADGVDGKDGKDGKDGADAYVCTLDRNSGVLGYNYNTNIIHGIEDPITIQPILTKGQTIISLSKSNVSVNTDICSCSITDLGAVIIESIDLTKVGNIGGVIPVKVTYDNLTWSLDFSYYVATSGVDATDKSYKIWTKAVDQDGKPTEASLGTFVDDDGKTKVKMSGDEILLEGNVTANGNVSIDTDGTLKAKEGIFENCRVEGFVSGGIAIPYDSISSKKIFVKDNLIIFAKGNSDIYLPVDPEYIGATIKIVVMGYIIQDSGTGSVSLDASHPNGLYNVHANIRAGRTFCKHTYSSDPEGLTYEENRDSAVGTMKEALYGTQWFYSPTPLDTSISSVKQMPNLIAMPNGVIELTGCQSYANMYITKDKYQVTESGTLVFVDHEPVVDKSDKRGLEQVYLTQWAITDFQPLGTDKLSDILKIESV